MAKIPLSDFPKHLKQSLDKAKQELLSPANMQKIGNQIAEQIVTRTRLGNGLDVEQGEPSKLKPLNPKYVEQRKTMQLSELASAKKSNLTQTGKMLSDVIAAVNGSIIKITFKDPSSKDKAKWNLGMGRTFMNISRVQVERLTNDIQKQIRQILKKYL